MAKKRLRKLLVGGVVLCIVALVISALAIDRFGVTQTARASGAIVVLGARVLSDGTASPTLQRRVEKAVALHRQGLAKIIVFSGGVGDFGASEASVAAALAQSNGVPAHDCLLEERSHSTRENAKFTALLLKSLDIDDAIVVSDPYHLFRATWLFEHEGIAVTTAPSLDAERHRSALQRTAWTLQEVLSLVKDAAVMAGEELLDAVSKPWANVSRAPTA